MNLDLNAMNLFGDNISLKQVFLDTIRPVGSVYVQYPQQDSPQDLFNGDGVASTWQEINYDGAFFRASGGNAASYIDKTKVLVKQSDQNKSHTHEMQNHTHSGTTGTVSDKYGSANTDGMSGNSNGKWPSGWNTHYAIDGSLFTGNVHATLEMTPGNVNGLESGARTYYMYNDISHTHNYDHAHDFSTGGPSNNTTTSDGGTECRPSNYTIKVWKRTA